MAEIIFLGVGGAMAANPADDHTALLVQEGEATILLDCGPAIMGQLERAGFDAGDPTHVYVSHQHGDHALGLPMLLLNRFIFWPERPLLIVAMPWLLDKLQQLVTLAYPDLTARLPEMAEFAPLAEEQGEHPLPGAGAIRYATAPGRHSVATTALRLTLTAGQSLVYTSDTAFSGRVADLASGADLLVHETFFLAPPPDGSDTHSAADQVGELAAQAGVQTLALVHRQDTSPAAAARYRAAAGKHFGGPILVPMAGDRIRV